MSDLVCEYLGVALNGAELALLLGAVDMVNSWPFRLNAPREKLAQDERRTAREIAAYLYEERRLRLVVAGVFMPPTSAVPSPEYVSTQAAIEAVVHLTQGEIQTCLRVLQFCHEELSRSPEEWRDFCSIALSTLKYFDLALTDLLRLSGRLEESLLAAPRLHARSFASLRNTDQWPPSGAMTISLNGVEFALLTGSLSLLDGWDFMKPAARSMLVESEMAMARSIRNYLVEENQSLLRAASALFPPALPAPPEFIAMRAAFMSQHFLMREHLRVCVAAIRICEKEFKEDWVYFCQTAPSGLHHFNPTPEELPRLAAKLESLLDV